MVEEQEMPRKILVLEPGIIFYWITLSSKFDFHPLVPSTVSR